MAEVQKLLQSLQQYIVFLSELETLNELEWTSPMEQGKWAVRDVISHIMMWDKNFLLKIIPQINNGRMPVLAEEEDVQGFNQRAKEYGELLSKEQLLEEAIDARQELLAQLERLPAAAFYEEVPQQGGYTLNTFLAEMFVSHDTHHEKQIKSYLEEQ